MNNRGFTLVELMIAAALTCLVAEAFSVGYANVIKSKTRLKAQATLSQSMNDLNSYLLYRLQDAGGGSVRPWAAVWVEDAAAARGPLPNGLGADRVTFTQQDPTVNECSVIGVTGANTLQIASPSGTCCLTPAFNNRQVVVLNGGFYTQYFATNVITGGGSCSVDVAPGQAYGGINHPPTGGFAGWVGGTISAGSVSTFYLDPAKWELHEFKDLNNNGTIDPGEDQTIITNVADFQAALGFDCNPQDGTVTDTADNNDEWLYNAAGDVMGAGGLTGCLPTDLRMLSVAVVLADASPLGPYLPVSALNGPARQRNGYVLSNSIVRFRFRNIGAFLQNG